MSSLKNNQWLIDRAYNMKKENADRTKTLLKCIYSIEKGEKTKEEALEEAVNKRAVSTAERYARSTATGLKSYGLLSSTFKITEVSVKYIQEKIDFRTLLLLQMIKKEHRFDDGFVIRPFFVILKFLLKLYDIDRENCWIDCYDYQEFLTELKTYSEFDEMIRKLLESRGNTREPRYSINNFDIWINAFISTNLICEVINSPNENIYKKYTLNLDELDFIKELVKNEDKISIIYNEENTKEKMLEDYGMFDAGLFEIMPSFQLDEGFEISNLSFDLKKILELYLFDGLSMEEIENEMFGNEAINHTRGSLIEYVLASLGINKENVKQGIWANYKTEKDLLRLNPRYSHLNKLFDILFGGNVQNCGIGFNKIYYGIPGCGKSYKVASILSYKDGFKEEANIHGINSPVESDYIFRTTFYLDYSNSDFVGQIYPVVEYKEDGSEFVTYKPLPGPFTKALLKAYTNPNKMVYLIIEEINRGNAAAIFGDLFQLLDRVKETQYGKVKGESEYPISNEFIEGYLKLVKNGSIQADGDISLLDKYINHNIIIPNNLTIFATMNTSDQNVFPLDTAFKRRWDLEKVTVDWSKNSSGEYNLEILNKCIPFTDMTWGCFINTINETMVEDEFISEDKNIGPYFIGEDILVNKEDRYNPENKYRLTKFMNNVIDYLYNDVTKLNHDILFKPGLKYSTLYKYFTEELHEDRTKQYKVLFNNILNDDIQNDDVNNIEENEDGDTE